MLSVSTATGTGSEPGLDTVRSEHRAACFPGPSTRCDITDDHFDLLSDIGYTYDSRVVSSRSIPRCTAASTHSRTASSDELTTADAPDSIGPYSQGIISGDNSTSLDRAPLTPKRGWA